MSKNSIALKKRVLGGRVRGTLFQRYEAFSSDVTLFTLCYARLRWDEKAGLLNGMR